MPKSFNLPEDAGVIACTRVVQGGTIVRVSHDDDGTWQFLCSEDHSVEAVCPPTLVALSDLVRQDPGIVELADLGAGWSASRPGAGGVWTRFDDTEFPQSLN